MAATATQMAMDRVHPELDEKHSSPTHSVVASVAPESVLGTTGLPSLRTLMHYAQIARAREAGEGDAFIAHEKTVDSKDSPRIGGGPPNIDEELLTARRALRTASWWAVFYLITTDILGPFNAPFAFSQVGYVPGVILYVVMGVAACYTGLILWKLYCALDSEYYPVRTYADLGEHIFGTWFKHLCAALQSLQLIINVGTICLSNAQSVAQIAVSNEFCFSIQILIWSLFGMIIGQIRTLKNYGWLANMAVWLNLLTIFITMGVVAHSAPNYAGAMQSLGVSQGPIVKTAFTHLPLYSKVNGIMQMVFAYGGAMIFPEFMAEMRRPMDFWKAMCCAQLLIVTVYMMFGLFVYSFQGQFTLPLAYQGVSQFAWQTVGNALALVTGIIAAGLYGNIGIKVAYYHVIEQWFKGPSLMSRRGHIYWSIMVLVYWALAFIVASAIPQVQTISGLVAAVCIMQFTYTFPPLLYAGFYMRLDAARDDPGDTWMQPSRWVRALKTSPELARMGAISGIAPGSRWYYKVFNLVLFLASLSMACLGMYGAGESIKATFALSGAATSFGCTAPV